MRRGFVKLGIVHFALRENRRLTGVLLETVAVAGVWLVAVVVGPFGTFDQLTTLERMQYWGMSIVLNWLQIRLAYLVLHEAFGRRRFWSPVLLASALAAVPATFEVIWLESHFRPAQKHDLAFGSLYLQVLLLTLVITIPLVHYFTGRGKAIELAEAAEAQAATTTSGTPAAAGSVSADADTGADADADSDSGGTEAANARPTVVPFLQRIPIRLGRDLLCLQAEDHYVRVYTAVGDDLILHRFSDSIQELDGLEGLQVHRSWWIARAAVADVIRRDRKTWLCLKNGLEVPVSRTYLAAVKEAGWS